MKRRIAVITGSRADYGLLRLVMQGILDSTDLKLHVIATGMHLSPEFGLTFREIEKDGFRIDGKVEMLLSSDTPVGVGKSIGIGVIGFSDLFYELKPDLIVVLGDRFEILAAVSAALVARIPVAHLHGGETTEGAFDESIRHSITKMSHLHFVAAEAYRNRVIQLGENPDRVFLVGGLGIDNIKRMRLMGREELETALDFQLGPKNLLITFHPVTMELSTSETQLSELLAALDNLNDTHLIFTMPNADTDGRKLFRMIEEFVGLRPNACAHISLGQIRYLSCIQHVDGVVGNSSSGILEVPSFNKGTINIGDRQKGRLKAKSIINCEPTCSEIASALEKLYSLPFKESLKQVTNPYGDGGASKKIVNILSSCSMGKLLKKTFYDIPFTEEILYK